MCDPVTVVTLGSIAAGAYGSYKEQEAYNKAADYNAQVAQENIELVDYQKGRVESLGRRKEAQTSQAASSATSQARAALAGSGVDVSGSLPGVIGSYNRSQANADILAIRQNVDEDIRALNVQRSSYKAQRETLLTSKVNPWESALLSVAKSSVALRAASSAGGGKG